MKDLPALIKELYYELSEEQAKELEDAFEAINFKKGEYVLKIGQFCQHLFLIVKGAVSYFRISQKGVKFNTWFSFENEIITDLESLVRNTPGVTDIVALEDCQMYAIHKNKLAALRKKFHLIETISRRLMEEYLIVNDKRTFSIQSNSAGDRYTELIELHPKLNERVSQTYIASYLGITKETLSRIKNKSI